MVGHFSPPPDNLLDTKSYFKNIPKHFQFSRMRARTPIPYVINLASQNSSILLLPSAISSPSAFIVKRWPTGCLSLWIIMVVAKGLENNTRPDMDANKSWPEFPFFLLVVSESMMDHYIELVRLVKLLCFSIDWGTIFFLRKSVI